MEVVCTYVPLIPSIEVGAQFLDHFKFNLGYWSYLLIAFSDSILSLVFCYVYTHYVFLVLLTSGEKHIFRSCEIQSRGLISPSYSFSSSQEYTSSCYLYFLFLSAYFAFFSHSMEDYVELRSDEVTTQFYCFRDLVQWIFLGVILGLIFYLILGYFFSEVSSR